MCRKTGLMLFGAAMTCVASLAIHSWADEKPAAADPIATPPAERTPEKKPSPAPAKPDPALEADIDKLIVTLTEGEWKAKEKAAEKLSGIGAAAAPKLKGLLEHSKDPDLITRVQGVLKQIDELQSFGPTTVSLDLKEATREEAFKAFAEKSGIKFTDGSSDAWTGGATDKQKRVTLKVEYEPYWSALLKLCDAAGAAPTDVTDGAVAIGPVSQKEGAAPAAASGPFLLTARQIEATRRVVFGAQRANPVNNGLFVGDGRSNYRLMLDACSEPKLKPISWSIDSMDCETDTGEQLTSRGGVFGGEVNTPQSTMLNLAGAGDKPATRIKKLTLNTHFVLLIKSKKIEIGNLTTAKESEHLLSGFRVVIRALVKQADDRYEIGFTAHRDVNGSDAAWRDFTQLIQNKYAPQVTDAEGKALNYAGGSSSSNGRELTITRLLMSRNFGAANTGPPAKLVWDFPEETKTVNAEFNLKDLPLP